MTGPARATFVIVIGSIFLVPQLVGFSSMRDPFPAGRGARPAQAA